MNLCAPSARNHSYLCLSVFICGYFFFFVSFVTLW